MRLIVNVRRTPEQPSLTMTFFEPRPGRGNFVVHFRSHPLADFGIWARGYTKAAHRLAESLLSRVSFADYEAYPVVFLYRHALELYLKAAVLQGTRLSNLREQEALYDKLQFDHRLPPLVTLAAKVLANTFPGDTGVPPLLERLERITRDVAALDPDSFVFRYPVSRSRERPVTAPIHVNLAAFAETMESLLGDLDTLDFALGAEIDQAEEILDYLYGLEP